MSIVFILFSEGSNFASMYENGEKVSLISWIGRSLRFALPKKMCREVCYCGLLAVGIRTALKRCSLKFTSVSSWNFKSLSSVTHELTLIYPGIYVNLPNFWVS